MRVVCTRGGVTVAGIPQARTFAPGDVVDLAAAAGTGTWADALGSFAVTHFEPERAAADVRPVDEETPETGV